MAPACPSRVPRARATARCATRSAPRAVRRALTRRRPASASRRCRVASATSVASRASAAALAASARDIRRLRPLRRRRSVELFAALAAQSLSGRVSPAGPRPFTCGQTMLLLLFMGPWLALASCLHRACACVCMWTRRGRCACDGGSVSRRCARDPALARGALRAECVDVVCACVCELAHRTGGVIRVWAVVSRVTFPCQLSLCAARDLASAVGLRSACRTSGWLCDFLRKKVVCASTTTATLYQTSG